LSTKTAIIEAIQNAADSYYADITIDEVQRSAVALALGTPGQRITIADQTNDSNAALTPEPTVFSTVIEGIASSLDASGVGEVAAIKAKLNQVIGQYNQLLSDHNSSTVPSTATVVSVLP